MVRLQRFHLYTRVMKGQDNINQVNKYVKTTKILKSIGVKDVSSDRQVKNGTQVWRLPFKDAYGYDIDFATYKSGYVRKLCKVGYAPCYQINRRVDSEPGFHQIKCGQHKGYYVRHCSRTCELIPKHGDRIEYLLKFILRNYFVAKPKYQPQLNMDSLNRMAKYVFGEFGFDSCDSDTQDKILKRIQE